MLIHLIPCDILGYDKTQSGKFTRFCRDLLPLSLALRSSETLITILVINQLNAQNLVLY